MNDKTSMFDYGMLYTPGMKDAWAGGYLNSPENYNKNFVQRIFNANPTTSLSRPAGNGGRESLRMASSGNNVFPTIQFRNGGLETIERGQRPIEAITTTTPEQAEVLAWNQYKRNNPDFGYRDQSELRNQYTL